jgi:3'(2'), 5'-bisphosphate nucleotidase
VASKSHINLQTEQYIASLKEKYGSIDLFSRGSSLKMCMVAEGNADLYPRLSPTMEWDTAAGHAIVKFAGGIVIDHSTGKEVAYNKPILSNPWFIAGKKRFMNF